MLYMDRPLIANMIVTRNCNIDCLFCGVEHMSTIRTRDAALEQGKAVVDELKRSGVLHINYFGGEPLFYRDFRELTSYVRQLGFFTTVVTNGRLITPSNVGWLSENVDAFAVSVHGLAGYHDRITRRNGAFDDTLRKLRLLSQLKPNLTVNMTVTDADVDDLREMVRLLSEEYGVRTFALNRCIGEPPSTLPPGYSRRDVSLSESAILRSLYIIDGLKQELPDVTIKYAIHFPYCIIPEPRLIQYVGGCGAGRNYFSIDFEGNVQFCSYMTSIAGNIFQESLLSIWRNSKTYTEFRSEDWMPERCLTCEHKDTCQGGCKVSTGGRVVAVDILTPSGR